MVGDPDLNPDRGWSVGRGGRWAKGGGPKMGVTNLLVDAGSGCGGGSTPPPPHHALPYSPYLTPKLWPRQDEVIVQYRANSHKLNGAIFWVFGASQYFGFKVNWFWVLGPIFLRIYLLNK